jgi:hypothetical protein
MGTEILLTIEECIFQKKSYIHHIMRRTIAELQPDTISPLFFRPQGSRPSLPAVRVWRGRSVLLPTAACAAAVAVGLALLPLAFVAVDHKQVVAWTNALFDLAGL